MLYWLWDACSIDEAFDVNNTFVTSSIATMEAMKTTGADWVLGNHNVVGYYRVNYDMANWDKLINILGTKHTVRQRRWYSYNPTAQIIQIWNNKHICQSLSRTKWSSASCFSRIFQSSTELSWWMMRLIWPGKSIHNSLMYSIITHIIIAHYLLLISSIL